MMSASVWRSYIDRATPILLDRINPHTGFYHFQQDQYNGATPVIAPMIENLMVVLFLLRTRTHENVLKAKEILEKLLPFAVETPLEVSFPRAIHEYPVPAHPSLMVGMLSVLLQIKIDFPVLGHQLITRLHNVTSKLFHAVQPWFIEKGSPSFISLLFRLLEVIDQRRSEASFLEGASNDFWLNNMSMEDTRALTQVVLLLERTSEKCSPLFEMLFARLYSIFNKEWKKTCSYGFNIKYFKNEFVSSLLEYYMSSRLGIPIDVSYVEPFFLDIGLVDPHLFHKKIVEQQILLPSYCATFSFPGVEVRSVLTQPKSNERFGFSPLRLITRNCSPVFSFPRARLLEITREGESLICSLESEEDVSHMEQLVHLYVETSVSNFSMSSAKTGGIVSYCRVGESVVVSFDGIRLLMKICSEAPSSWALLRGNRSGQLEKKSSSGKIGFDWLVSCSTVNSQGPLKYKLIIEVL